MPDYEIVCMLDSICVLAAGISSAIDSKQKTINLSDLKDLINIISPSRISHDNINSLDGMLISSAINDLKRFSTYLH